MQKIDNYINGEITPPLSGEYLDNFDPSTGSIYSAIADSDERDVQSAVEAANAAFPAWSKTSTELRHDIIMRLVALIERAARLAGAKMESTDFSKANLSGADLRGSNAKWANFTGANLAGADLRNADLFHATFDDGDLSDANLAGAYLFGANLINTRAPRADFSGAYLKLSLIHISEPTRPY